MVNSANLHTSRHTQSPHRREVLGDRLGTEARSRYISCLDIRAEDVDYLGTKFHMHPYNFRYIIIVLGQLTISFVYVSQQIKKSLVLICFCRELTPESSHCCQLLPICNTGQINVVSHGATKTMPIKCFGNLKGNANAK